MTQKWDVRNVGGESLSTDGLLTREDAERLADEIEREHNIEVVLVEVDTKDES